MAASRGNIVRWEREAAKRGHEAAGGKICVTCKTWKPFAEYWKHSGGRYGLRPQCKDCIRAVSRSWRTNNPEKAHQHHRRSLTKRYRITPEQYAKRLAEQQGVCAICRQPSDKMLSIDHDHNTGVVRGLLCRRCNSGLGHFHDDFDLLNRASVYLFMGSLIARHA